MTFKTDQEAFWAGSFGTEYILRNQGAKLLASNLNFFSQALRSAGSINSCIEFGANVGMNLRALQLLYPLLEAKAVEINGDAASQLAELLGSTNVFHGSIFDYPAAAPAELTLIKGVLIHINPKMLALTYQKLYYASSRWVLVCEYYNPTPTVIPYRGSMDRMFKRDFAGEMLDMFPSLHLVDYGFTYRRDPGFEHDDINWFLMEKRS